MEQLRTMADVVQCMDKEALRARPMTNPALWDMFPTLNDSGLELPVLVAAGDDLTSTLLADTLGTFGSRSHEKQGGSQSLHGED